MIDHNQPNEKLDYLKMAELLADARVKYSETWLRHRLNATSDQQATHRATVETGDDVTRLEARLELARRNLHRR